MGKIKDLKKLVEEGNPLQIISNSKYCDGCDNTDANCVCPKDCECDQHCVDRKAAKG